MPAANINELVIDAPADRIDAVQDFYAGLTGYTVWRNEESNPMLENPDGMDIGFQRVIESYQPPTWPSQERGQQVHIDFATDDLEAAATYAESLGATRAAEQPEEGLIIMLDPVGHPLCLVQHNEWDGERRPVADGGPSIKYRVYWLDCADHEALTEFYLSLLGGERLGEAPGKRIVIRTPNGAVVGLQRVEDYQPPTWPSQERGQQMHVDIYVDDMDAVRARAESLGATHEFTPPESSGYLVMLDPAGHPFCLCQEG